MSESSTPKGPTLGLATDLLHADDDFHGKEVAPSISVTTSASFDSYLDGCGLHISWTPAFRQPESPELTVKDTLGRPVLVRGSNAHVYSRVSQSVSTRVEHVLSKINVRNIHLARQTLTLRDVGRLRYHLRIWSSCHIRCMSTQAHY